METCKRRHLGQRILHVRINAQKGDPFAFEFGGQVTQSGGVMLCQGAFGAKEGQHYALIAVVVRPVQLAIKVG